MVTGVPDPAPPLFFVLYIFDFMMRIHLHNADDMFVTIILIILSMSLYLSLSSCHFALVLAHEAYERNKQLCGLVIDANSPVL